MRPEDKLIADDGLFYPNTGIFANNAPIMWQYGLPVIPLRPRDKAPLTPNWSQYQDKMPTPQEQDHWVRNYPDSNIGLPLGPQSQCVAIDIDTADPVLIDIISKICGYTPWERIGKKGMVRLYKYSGEKPFKIKDTEGHMICECLSSGNQVVLPPSIHPSTQKPYRANQPITEALAYLHTLPKDIEDQLRDAFTNYGIQLSHSGWTRTTDFVSQGSRDVKMTSMAGFLANGVTRGELSLLEAMDRMRAWNSMCVENVAGDDIDIEKGIRQIAQFLVNDVCGPKQKPLPQGWDAGLTPEQKKSLGLDFSAEHEEWNIGQILGYLKTEFEKFPNSGDVQRISSVDYVLRRIAYSPHLTSLEVETVINYICMADKNTFVKATLRKRIQELISGEMEGTDHTEIAKSVLSDLKRTGDIIFYHDRLQQWAGSNWEELEDAPILSHIAQEYGKYPAARKANDHAGILRIIKSLVPNEDPDKRRINGVNFANCYLDSEQMMHPHDPSFGCFYTLPYRYVPEQANNHPMFDRFLKSIWGHLPDFEERVQALREVICSAFFGMGSSFARAVLFYGLAGSGKSQLIEIIKHLLPDNVVTYVTPYNFDKPFEVVELSKSLVNICGELNETKKIPGAQFKSVIDGSSIQASRKYGQPFSFSPRAIHFFASNYLPKTEDTSAGFSRRWLIFSFDRVIPKEEKVRDIGDIIVAQEREAIAAWAIQCSKDLAVAGDYTLPSSHRNTIREMICENDSVLYFLLDESASVRLVEKEAQTSSSRTGTRTSSSPQEYSLPMSVLYEKYTNFCIGVLRCRSCGFRIFLTRMTELGAFIGFRVTSTTAYGLTIDPTQGKRITYEP